MPVFSIEIAIGIICVIIMVQVAALATILCLLKRNIDSKVLSFCFWFLYAILTVTIIWLMILLTFVVK